MGLGAAPFTPRLFEDTAELSIVRLAVDLGAESGRGPLSPAEHKLAEAGRALPPDLRLLEQVRAGILRGDDPLGEMLCRVRPPEQRRPLGAFYTPAELVDSMVEWVLARRPQRVVDVGCGSGRFATAVVRRVPDTVVFAVDVDPLATLLARAALAVLGARGAVVQQADYTTWQMPEGRGPTAFIGNPPYVRHHDLSPAAKAWAREAGKLLGHKVSGLSGLHAHFYLATMLRARPGDVGCFVTSAEWLDVGYGAALRDLFLNGLGGQELHLIDPAAATFGDVQATAVIACFERGGAGDAIGVRSVGSPGELRRLAPGRPMPRAVLAAASRWSPLVRADDQADAGAETVPLGSLVRVHRGLVTGANDYFVLTRQHAADLGLLPWCRPAITDAQEIIRSGGIIRDSNERKLLLDVPRDVDRQAHPRLDSYLRRGEIAQGAEPAVAERYIASHRRPWWFLGRQPPPPIVASYMARQAPAFALNPDGLALINIGHGLYPRRDLGGDQLATLCSRLNAGRSTFVGRGRTYQGGLEKFEPREMESLPVDPSGLERA